MDQAQAQAQIPPEQLAMLAKENRGPMTAALVITFTAFAFVCVLLRFAARVETPKMLGWEDLTIAVSMVFSIATAVCQVAQIQSGVGRHAMFVPQSALVQNLKWLFFGILTYCVSLTLTKISILLQYRRIFSVKETRRPIYAVMGLCIAYGIECILSGTFTCMPVDAFWNVWKRPTAKCIDQTKLYYANASLNIATDLMIAVLPIRAIWRLQMVRTQKIALSILLSLGWFVCIVSVLRLNALIVAVNHPLDRSYYGVGAVYWTAIEMNLAIVCASAPALKPFICRLVPSFSSRRATSTDPNTERSGTSKTSKHTNHSFKRLHGKKSSSTMNSDPEQGTNTIELSPVPAIAPMLPRAVVPIEIRVMSHEQQSYPRPSDGSGQHALPNAQYSVWIQHWI